MAKAALEAAEVTQVARRAELEDLAARLGDRQRFRSFERLVRQHELEAAAAASARQTFERRDRGSAEARARSAERAGAAAETAAALFLADEALAGAADRVTESRAALLHARHAEMALDLRATLVTDGPCPVCEQPVHTLPKRGAAPKVTASEKAVAAAEKAEAKARRSRDEAAGAEATARAGVTEADQTLTETVADREQAELELGVAETTLTATKGQLVDRLGQGDPRLLLEAREAELATAESALDEAKKEVESARHDFDLATEAERAAASGPAGLANRLAGVWGRLGQDREVSAGPSAIRAAFYEVRRTISAGHDDAQAALTAAEGLAAEADRAMDSLRATIGLAAGEDFRTAMTETEVRHGTAAARVSDLEVQITRSKNLESDVLAAQAQRSMAERLAEDLKPSRFLAFLLEEERAELAELGSMHFELLTDGGYRFAADDSFDIEDLNAAGSIRKSDSLSGGETFLASLALALALAQMVARGGGRLDAFFLDEGFGSLDPDHLDRAMDGIGRLVAQDERRIVVLVSHVAEMREAVEDLIVLDKDVATGDSIVRSGASRQF
jgi:exonuclease SbcC